MNDHQYTNIRNYLEEQSSLLRQNLAEQKRTNELLNEIRLGVNRTDGRLKETIGADIEKAVERATKAQKEFANAISPATVEKQLETETGHDVVKTGSNPPTFVETDKPATTTKTAAKKSK